MNIKISGELNSILEVLKLMAQSEQMLGELYRACGIKWSEDRDFWTEISSQEDKHALYIKKIGEIISKRPENFEKGRPFNVFAIKTIIKGMQDKLLKIKEGSIPRKNAFFTARDFEQSILEDRYGEIVKSDDIEYIALTQEILSDTLTHKNRLDQKIKEITEDKK